MGRWAYLGLLLLLQQQLSVSNAVTVETIYGTVEGQTLTLQDPWYDGISINSFYAIPFATPPVGNLRFALPIPPEPWDDVFVADTLGSACQQYLSALDWTNPGWRDYDEDCLHLNIFAPADQSGAPYPVMVWIYGGAYFMGANIQYPGHFLAAHDVVVVIPNYRLEMFGFGYSGDDEIPGNMGLWDQTMALQFVQDNIAAFGGDPDMVTIFGQSAGATSSGQHIMSPQSAGLFHQAILQSGCDLSHWGTNQPDQDPVDYLYQAAEFINCSTETTAIMTECLRNKTALQIRAGYAECTEGYWCMGWAPVVDGPGGFMPDSPYNLRMSGDFNHVSEITGYNRHDGFTMAAAFGPEMIVGGPDREAFQRIISDILDYFNPRYSNATEADMNAAADFYYTPWPYLDDQELNRFQLGMAATDAGYGYNQDLQARSQAEFAPVFYYIFDYRATDNFMPEWCGTSHSAELIYTHGYPFIRYNPEVRLETRIADLYEYDDLDDEWAYFILTLWTNYAKYGTPTPTPVQPPGDHDPIVWEEFQPGNDHFSYMFLGDGDDEESMGNSLDYRQHEQSFWREYLPYLVTRDHA